MAFYNDRKKGFTLLEVLLVLLVGAGLFVLSIRAYLSFKREGDIAAVRYNVDQLFEAGADYYQANCRMPRDPETGVADPTYGTLDPDYTPEPASEYPVAVSALQTDGFLRVPLNANPFVNSLGVGGGYIVQFNRAADSKRTITEAITGNSINVGNIIVWKVQVAVELRTRDVPGPALVKLLGADCLSSRSGSIVTPCDALAAPPVGGTVYAVWSKLPSDATPHGDPNAWLTNNRVKAFNQLYTNNDRSFTTTSTSQQNYLCGS